MIAILKGKTAEVHWRIIRTENKITEDFTGAELNVFLIGPDNTYSLPCTIEIVEGFNEIHLSIDSSSFSAGVYDLKAVWIKNKTSIPHFVNSQFITVSRKGGVLAVTDSPIEATPLPVDNAIKLMSYVESYGRDGMSAYELAAFRGLLPKGMSEKEWVSQENIRQQNEAKRIEAEDARKENEDHREAYEQSRKEQESIRVQNEKSRQSSEAEREATFTASEEARQAIFEENEEKRWGATAELKEYVDERVATLDAQIKQNKGVIESVDATKAEKSTVAAIQNTLNAKNPPVAKPTIHVEWIAHNNDGTELESVPNEGGTMSNPIVETGYKMRYDATYSWKSAEGYQDPTSVDTANSDWKDESTPPGSGVSSESIVLDSPTVTSDKTLKITLQAKEVGLKTDSDGYLVPASGFVKSSASVGVTFRNRLYYGVTTEAVITEEVIKSLGFKSLVQSNAQTLTGITQTDEQYFVYASTSRITSIIQDGATPVLGAFIETQVDVTNAAGYKRTYYVYRTTNKKAFTNATLKFS